MFTLENNELKVRVRKIGAELCGLYGKKEQREYMWQPGNEIWDHSSLLLFPNPGRIARDRTVIDGKVYPAAMHGFACKREFAVVSHSADKLLMELRADEQTYESFPYEFCLQVTFRLEGDTLYQELAVINEGGRRMYFCIGAHPGFYLPLVLGESGNDYVVRFDRKQSIRQLMTQPGTMLLTGVRREFLQDATDVNLSEDYFNNGPLLLEGVSADTVMLLSKKSGHFVEIGIRDFPFMCLWGNGYKNAMICIEPWCGTSDLADTDHVWETKLGIELAEAGETFIRTLSFRVG